MPCASSRSVAQQVAGVGLELDQQRRGPSPRPAWLRARPSLVSIATISCCAPSWMSRSIRRRSASCGGHHSGPGAVELAQLLRQLGGEPDVARPQSRPARSGCRAGPGRRRRTRPPWRRTRCGRQPRRHGEPPVESAASPATVRPPRGPGTTTAGSPSDRDPDPRRSEADRYGVGHARQQVGDPDALLERGPERLEHLVAVGPAPEHQPIGQRLQPSASGWNAMDTMIVTRRPPAPGSGRSARARGWPRARRQRRCQPDRRRRPSTCASARQYRYRGGGCARIVPPNQQPDRQDKDRREVAAEVQRPGAPDGAGEPALPRRIRARRGPDGPRPSASVTRPAARPASTAAGPADAHEYRRRALQQPSDHGRERCEPGDVERARQVRLAPERRPERRPTR